MMEPAKPIQPGCRVMLRISGYGPEYPFGLLGTALEYTGKAYSRSGERYVKNSWRCEFANGRIARVDEASLLRIDDEDPDEATILAAMPWTENVD